MPAQMTRRVAGRPRGSTIRYIAAMVALISALVVIPGGFVFMVRGLEGGSYGTSRNDLALAWLAVGGGLLALGIALLLWELSVRYNVRH